MDDGRAQLSRFQVLCVERPAWAWPALRRETRYYYDGLRFWSRSTARGPPAALLAGAALRLGARAGLRLPPLRLSEREGHGAASGKLSGRRGMAGEEGLEPSIP